MLTLTILMMMREANVPLMASSSYNPSSDFDDENEVFFTLTRSKLISTIQDLLNNVQSKSRKFKHCTSNMKLCLTKSLH